MNSRWKTIVPGVEFDTENRGDPSSIVLSDGKRFLIQGGYNTYGFNYINQTIIFDTSSNTWSKGTKLTDEKGVAKQIYCSTAVNLPDNSIGFYGGFDQFSSLSDNATYSDNYGAYTGFSQLTTLALDSGKWSSFSPLRNTLTGFYPKFQTATFNPISGKIYYLGGIYDYAVNSRSSTRTKFNWAAVFNTNSGDWLNATLKGDAPTDRTHHTANLLPNSQDIILYGGSSDGVRASDNYCYTLNLETNTWTMNKNIGVPWQISGPRFGHSAVLVKSTLFILFGRGNTGKLGFPLLTIDVSNTSNIAYTDTYFATTNKTTNTTTETTTDLTKPEGLSKEAIGGIAGGSAVAVLGIVILAFFFLWRRKKVKGQYSRESMGVNWGEIEEEYREVPTAKSNFLQFTESTEIIENSNKQRYSSNSAENNSNLLLPKNVTPDGVVNITKPSISSSGDYVSVKPDVQ